MTKFDLVKKTLLALGCTQRMRLLDVGCRNCQLRNYVGDIVEYSGVDLLQNDAGTVDFVLDVEKGLPIEDATYDYVVALDLLEHLNDFQGTLEDLLRVTKRSLLVALPNMGHIFFRLSYLFKARINAKYDLKYGMGQDRHRWLPVLPQSNTYMGTFAEDKGLELEIVHYAFGKKKSIFAKVAKRLWVPPIWWAWATLYIFTKTPTRSP